MTDWMYEASNLQGQLESARSEISVLQEFYREVSKLTLRHDVIGCVDGNEYASVSPAKLGALLEKIDPQWIDKIKGQHG